MTQGRSITMGVVPRTPRRWVSRSNLNWLWLAFWAKPEPEPERAESGLPGALPDLDLDSKPADIH